MSHQAISSPQNVMSLPEYSRDVPYWELVAAASSAAKRQLPMLDAAKSSCIPAEFARAQASIQLIISAAELAAKNHEGHWQRLQLQSRRKRSIRQKRTRESNELWNP